MHHYATISAQRDVTCASKLKQKFSRYTTIILSQQGDGSAHSRMYSENLQLQPTPAGEMGGMKKLSKRGDRNSGSLLLASTVSMKKVLPVPPLGRIRLDPNEVWIAAFDRL